jgi:hypothetical protein
VLYEMVTGKRAFAGKSHLSVASRYPAKRTGSDHHPEADDPSATGSNDSEMPSEKPG